MFCWPRVQTDSCVLRHSLSCLSHLTLCKHLRNMIIENKLFVRRTLNIVILSLDSNRWHNTHTVQFLCTLLNNPILCYFILLFLYIWSEIFDFFTVPHVYLCHSHITHIIKHLLWMTLRLQFAPILTIFNSKILLTYDNFSDYNPIKCFIITLSHFSMEDWTCFLNKYLHQSFFLYFVILLKVYFKTVLLLITEYF